MAGQERLDGHSTGQVYHEWLLSPARPDPTGGYLWDREKMLPPGTAPSTTATVHTRGSKGVRSLVELCAAVCGAHFNQLHAEDLQYVPDRVLGFISNHIGGTAEPVPMSFHEWKLLHTANTGHSARKHLSTRFRIHVHSQEIKKPWVPLKEYTKRLMSPKFDFIVHLTIAGAARFSSGELARLLPQMTNLGVLEIIQPRDPKKAHAFPRVTDLMVREWSQIPGVFPCLRVLRIWGEDFTTIRSIKDAMRFPVLAVYDIAGRRDDTDFRKHKAFHWQFSASPGWKNYLGWGSEAECDPSRHPFHCFDRKHDSEWMFTTKSWEGTSENPKSVRSSSALQNIGSFKNTPICMVLKVLRDEEGIENGDEDEKRISGEENNKGAVVWNAFVDHYDRTLRHYMAQYSNEPVSLVPEHQVTKSSGFHSDSGPMTWTRFARGLLYDVPGLHNNPAESLCFGSWGFILYSQLGKLWRDADLRAQGVPIHQMAVMQDKHYRGGFDHIIPTRPYVSLSLGQLDRLYCPDPNPEVLKAYARAGHLEAHVTFLRMSNPFFGDDAGTTGTTEEQPPKVPQKGPENVSQNRQENVSQNKQENVSQNKQENVSQNKQENVSQNGPENVPRSARHAHPRLRELRRRQERAARDLLGPPKPA